MLHARHIHTSLFACLAVATSVSLPALAGFADAIAANDLCPLSDEFDDATTLPNWTRIHEHEEWFADQLEVFDIDGTIPGQMTLMPHTVVWYQDYRGPLVFKEVTGDAAITGFVTVTGRDGVSVPSSDYSLGGILVREPRSVTPGTWAPGGENYVFLSIGYGQVSPRAFQFEVKTTIDSVSNLELSPAAGASAQIQTARVGEYVIALIREAPGDWRVHRRYHRPDFGPTLQVGAVSYTDWPKCSTFEPFHHNSVTIEPGMDGDPSPGTPFEPDALARFDYLRFQRIELPAHLEGLDLTDPVAVPDVELLAFLGENALPPEHEDCDVADVSEPPYVTGVGSRGSLGEMRLSRNPVVGSAEVELTLHESGRLAVELIDPSGRRVARVFSGFVGSGEQLIRVDVDGAGVDLGSGVYFLRATLTAGGTGLGTSQARIVVAR
ncbi:MAG: hypothetical protein R3E97_02165 [Candidatus Eisenbacteria bacterium]